MSAQGRFLCQLGAQQAAPAQPLSRMGRRVAVIDNEDAAKWEGYTLKVRLQLQAG